MDPRGDNLPTGYCAVRDPVFFDVVVKGPDGPIVRCGFEEWINNSGLRNEVIREIHMDMKQRKEREQDRISVVDTGSRAMEKQLARMQKEAEKEIMRSMLSRPNRSPAALARLHREAARAGKASPGCISGSFTDLFKQLDASGMIPSRGERFGEPPIKPNPKGYAPDRIHRGPIHRVKKSAEDDCRDIERMGARRWLLERHKMFVKGVRA